MENTIFKGILCKVDFNLDSRALFLFTERAAIWALRELRVGIATLKGPVAQTGGREILLSAIVIFSKKREKKILRKEILKIKNVIEELGHFKHLFDTNFVDIQNFKIARQHLVSSFIVLFV